MKAAILAISALVWIAGCERADKAGKEAKEDTEKAAEETKQGAEKAGEEAKKGTEKAGEEAGKATSKTEEEARQAGRDVKEGTEKAVHKTEEEARQTGRDVKEGTDKAVHKTEAEVRQTERDLKETMAKDKGMTKSDKQLNSSIRKALKANLLTKGVNKDVHLNTTNGMVLLSGTVPKSEEVQAIVEVVEKTAGKNKVRSELKASDRVGAGSSENY